MLAREDGALVRCLGEGEKKALFRAAQNAMTPADVDLGAFDDIQFAAEDAAETKKEEVTRDAIGRNSVKIESRIRANNDLLDVRVRQLEDDLIAASGREEERLRRAIERERTKTAEKNDILRSRLNQVGTYSLDAVCLLDPV